MTPRQLLPLFVLTGLLASLPGCDEVILDTSDPEETDADADGDSDGDADGDSDADADNAPYIVSADAYCTEHTTGKTFWLWEASCVADDPQGTDTIPSFAPDGNVLTVLNQTGTAIHTSVMACDSDGNCSTYFTQDESGAVCAQASSYTLRFQVVDEDGNVSQPYDVQGRQGS